MNGSGGEHIKAVRVIHDAQDVAKQVEDRRSCELGLPLQRGGVAWSISLHWLTICSGSNAVRLATAFSRWLARSLVLRGGGGAR